MLAGRDEARTARVTVALLTVLGGALRFAFLSQPMRLDETASFARVASRPLAEMTRDYLPNNHALHTVLVHFATTLFGNSPVSIRATAFVAGILVVPATYALFEEILDRPTALLAAALAAASSPLVEYSTDARGYTMETVFVLAVFYAAAKVLRAGAPGWWGVLLAAAVLGFATIPTMAFFFGGGLLWMLASTAANDDTVYRRRMAGRLALLGAAALALVALVYLPVILGSGLAAVTSNRWVKPLSWGDFTAGLWGSLAGDLASWHRGLPLAVALLLGGGFVVSLVVFRRISRFAVNPVPPTLLSCVVLMTLQRVLPPERVWLPLVPLYLGSAAAGWRWVAQRLAAIAPRLANIGPLVPAALTVLVFGSMGTLVLAANSPYQTPDQVTFRDAEPLTEILAGVLHRGDIVYVHLDAAYVLEYYFQRHGIPVSLIYRPERAFPSVSRAFAIDSSTEYPPFTFREALSAGNLSRSKEYDIAVIAELPHATLYSVLDPVLAAPPQN